MRKRTRRSFATAAIAYDAIQSEGAGDEFVIPEDLTALSAEELAALHTQASEHFDALYGDGTGLTDENLAALGALTDGLEALAAEVATRDAAAAERDAAAAALAARVRPAGDSTEELAAETSDEAADEDSENVDEEAAEASDADASADADSLEASGRRTATRIPLSAVRSRQRTNPAEQAQQRAAGDTDAVTLQDVLVASGDGLGYAVGTGIDFRQAGEMLDRRLGGFSEAAYQRAAASGRHMTETHSLLQIRRPIPADLMVDPSMGADHVREVMDRAADESRLPGGSLVASGGWCAPSQVIYDLIGENESRDGLLSIPEIGITRGGISWTTGPDFRDIFNEITGFAFTEEEDIEGLYAHPNPVNWAATTTVAQGQYRDLPDGTVLRAVIAGTTGASAPAAPGTLGGRVVDGTVTWERVPYALPNVAGDKPCYKIECPPFEEYRLDVDGLCITAGILQSRGFPEVQGRTIRGALVAHDHRLNGKMIAQMAAGSTSVTLPATQAGTAAPVLTAIELQVEHYRYSRRLARSTTLEAVFPFWIRGAVRSDLSRRTGMAMFDVTDAQIDAWFRTRGVNPQFVYNWQAIDVQSVSQFTSWPTAVSFLLYAAGTWVRGAADIITLDNLYDSQLLGQNDFTALFTEEGWFVAKRGQDSRLVTTSLTANGVTAIAKDIAHNGVAA